MRPKMSKLYALSSSSTIFFHIVPTILEPPVNKNLAKYWAYTAKTREAIEDGTAAKERKEKAEDLKGLIDWELERLEKSAKIASGPSTLNT